MGFIKCVILPLFLVGLGCSQFVNSQQQTQHQQQQQQPQPHSQIVNQHQPLNLQQAPQDSVISAPLDNQETQITNHYPYQSPSLSQNNGYHQPYSGSTYGNKDVYSSNNGGWGWNNPYFGVSTGTAWELTAYFGPVFWAFVAVVATFGFCVGVSRLFLGTDIFGGMFQKIKDATPTGKSLDLDNITNLVYQAFDTYGRYSAKQARHESTAGIKG